MTSTATRNHTHSTNMKVFEARRSLRKLEMEAYALAVDVFRAQGVLTDDKLEVLQKLCHYYQIPEERHFAELRRAVSDDDLNEIAETLVGYDPTSSWLEEAMKYIDLFKPFIPKSHFTANAFRAISNFYANSLMRSHMQANQNGVKQPEQVERRRDEVVRVNTEHEYYCTMNPLASQILAEYGTEQESAALSRAYLTPLGLEGLTDAFTDPNSCNPPLSPSRDLFLDVFSLTNGNMRGTEPSTLPTKRRRNASEHRSVDESPGYEGKRFEKTPSNTTKIMQDYQQIMTNMRKKGKLPDQQGPAPTAERKRGKGKRVESVTQESPGLGTDGKNVSGLIIPCISIERMPLSQPKSDTSPPLKQQKIDTPLVKSGRIKWKKRKLPKTPVDKTMRIGKKGVAQEDTQQLKSPAPVKRRKQIRVKPTSLNSDAAKRMDTSTTPPSDTFTETSVDIIRLEQQSVSEDSILTQPLIVCQSDDVMVEAQPAVETQATPPLESEPTLPPDTPSPSSHSVQIESDVPIPSPPTQLHTPQCDVTPLPNVESTPANDVFHSCATENPITERVMLGRGKKDSTNSLDIPSPGKIKSGLQGLYSPISSLDTPPEQDRSTHKVLVSESTPMLDQLIPRPLFSPITSPEDSFSQSPVKGASTSDQLSLILQEPHIDILTSKCSLALSDIVDEVCGSISDLPHPSAEETKPPFTPSSDTVFADSSFMLSKALDSFITRVISDEKTPEEETATPPLPPPPPPLPTDKELLPVESLDFAHISASLLSMEQQTGGTSPSSPKHPPPT